MYEINNLKCLKIVHFNRSARGAGSRNALVGW